MCLSLCKSKFLKKKYIRTLKRLDPDQDRRSVGPDLDPNCLQRVSVDASKERVKISTS